jgi:hypothetical protein
MTTTLAPDLIDDLPAALRGSDALSGLTESEVRELVGRMTAVTLIDGDEVIRQGATCEALYLVLSGTVAVSARNRRGLVRPVEEVGPGNLVGDAGICVRRLLTTGARAPSGSPHCRRKRLTASAIDARRRRWRWSTAGPAAALSAAGTALHVCEAFGHLEGPALGDLDPSSSCGALRREALFRQVTVTTTYIVTGGRLASSGRPRRLEMLLAEPDR